MAIWYASRPLLALWTCSGWMPQYCRSIDSSMIMLRRSSFTTKHTSLGCAFLSNICSYNYKDSLIYGSIFIEIYLFLYFRLFPISERAGGDVSYCFKSLFKFEKTDESWSPSKVIDLESGAHWLELDDFDD